MSDITSKIETQMARVMEAINRALIRAARRSLAEGAQPGLAADYARRYPAAAVADIVAATGCSKTTARKARRAWSFATTSQASPGSGDPSRGQVSNRSERENGNDSNHRL